MSLSKVRFTEAVEHGKSLRWDALLKERASHPEISIVGPYNRFCEKISWLMEEVAERASEAQLEEYTQLLGTDRARRAFRDGSSAQLELILDVWRPALVGARR